MPIRFLTGNRGKLTEVQRIIPQVQGMDVDLPEIQELDARKVIEAKLNAASAEGALMVEDTSLYLDALNGLPGPFITWFLKSLGAEGVYQLADNADNYRAEAKTIIGYQDESGAIEFFEGSMPGMLMPPRGETGFGWDVIFQPDGHTQTFAEMGVEEKNTLSMRVKAAEKLKERIQQ